MGRREKRWRWGCQDGKILRLIPVGASFDSFFTFSFVCLGVYIFCEVGIYFALTVACTARW